MTSQVIKLNRLARSLSLSLIQNAIYHDHEKVKRIVHNKLGNIISYRMIKTAKQSGNNSAEMAMEMATDIAMKLLDEVPEIYKFTYVSNIHQIIQNLFDRLYKNILRGEQRGASRKEKTTKGFSS